MSGSNDAWPAAARLVRRLGFGATGSDVDEAVRLGPQRYLVTALTTPADTSPAAPALAPRTPPGKGADATVRKAANRRAAAEQAQLTAWWLRRMVTTNTPAAEKLTFCWHNHFATSAAKVRSARWLKLQNDRLRDLGRSDFHTLALAMLTDAAMLRWLDGDKNTAAAPNENLAREFMELFALGHGDGYTETDVRAGAKALTGWRTRPDGSTFLDPRRHDDTPQTFLGTSGVHDVASYCAAVLARPPAPRYLVTRWWGQLASDDPPSEALLGAVTAAYGPRRDLTAMFTAMLSRPEFLAATGTLVIGPVEWLVGALRALKVDVTQEATATKLLGALRALGQEPFYPPSVGGWPGGQAWLSTAAADLRLRIASTLTRSADLAPVAGAAQANRLDAVAHLLGVASWSARSAAALRPEVAAPDRLVTLALVTPEYLVH